MSSQPTSNRIVVLHFIGAGRSGSTILNIVLDNHPDIIGTGELIFFARSLLNNDYCSCGRPLNNCPFWVEVQHEWLKRTGMKSPEEYVKLQEQFERYRTLPKILFAFRSSSQEFQRYCHYTFRLYEIIKEFSGALVISDSSKNPIRVLLLSAISEIDLRIIYMVRDARGYAWSRMKAFEKNHKAGLGRSTTSMTVWKSTLQWIAISLVSECVLRQVNNYILIRYEDLISDTQQVLSEIGTFINMELSPVTQLIARGDELEIKHISAGNRLRMKKKIRLKKQETWQMHMSANKKITSWILAGWLMKKYGY